MCGRYTLKIDNGIYDRFSLDSSFKSLKNETKEFNVVPGEFMPIITYGSFHNQLSFMRWGLIPSWAKDDKIGQHLFNARSETILEKPSFKTPFRRHRCLVPANGFYEWKKENGQSFPYFFTLKDTPLFSFAGIFDSWLDPNGSEYESYTIITTTPNVLVKSIHHRMPVILRKEDEGKWLSPSNFPDKLTSLLQPYTSSLMEVTKL